MKEIKFTKNFEKAFKKRISPHSNLHKKFTERLKSFEENPKNPTLHDHPLTGTKLGKRAFSITGDYRVVYREEVDYFVFYDVGTHNQVY